MDFTTRYRIRSPQVACQTVQGESVLINFESGCYYSAEGVGSSIIELLEQRATVGEIAGQVAAACGCPPEELDAAIRSFLGELEAEGLIVTDLGAVRAEASPPVLPGHWDAGPTLRKFSDLQDLLLLDPIHDSGDAGWPWPPGEPSRGGP